MQWQAQEIPEGFNSKTSQPCGPRRINSVFSTTYNSQLMIIYEIYICIYIHAIVSDKFHNVLVSCLDGKTRRLAKFQVHTTSCISNAPRQEETCLNEDRKNFFSTPFCFLVFLRRKEISCFDHQIRLTLFTARPMKEVIHDYKRIYINNGKGVRERGKDN